MGLKRGLAAVTALGALVSASAVAACATFDAANPTGPSADASSDAPADGSGNVDARRFCERFVPDGGTTLYCRDFDDGLDIRFDWGETTLASGGNFEIDTTTTATPPGALVARLPADVSPCSYAHAVKEIGTLGSTMTLAFDVRLGPADADTKSTIPGMSFMELVLDYPTASCRLIFSGDGSNGVLHEQDAKDIPHAMSFFPLPGQWTHIEMSITRTPPTIAIIVDGRTALAPAPLDPSCISGTDEKVEVEPGLRCENATTAIREIRLDDIVVSGAP